MWVSLSLLLQSWMYGSLSPYIIMMWSKYLNPHPSQQSSALLLTYKNGHTYMHI